MKSEHKTDKKRVLKGRDQPVMSRRSEDGGLNNRSKKIRLRNLEHSL